MFGASSELELKRVLIKDSLSDENLTGSGVPGLSSLEPNILEDLMALPIFINNIK